MSQTIDDIKASLDGLKNKMAGLKTRATSLNSTREDLIRQAATLEQTQQSALSELKDLGIVPKDLTPETLEALALTTHRELESAIAELESTVSQAEALIAGKPVVDDVLGL